MVFKKATEYFVNFFIFG